MKQRTVCYSFTGSYGEGTWIQSHVPGNIDHIDRNDAEGMFCEWSVGGTTWRFLSAGFHLPSALARQSRELVNKVVDFKWSCCWENPK